MDTEGNAPVQGEHQHRWVGSGDYGDTTHGYMCADCGVDAEDVAEEDARTEAARLQKACAEADTVIAASRLALLTYAAENPKWVYEGVEQDPSGVHAAVALLKEYSDARAATGSLCQKCGAPVGFCRDGCARDRERSGGSGELACVKPTSVPDGVDPASAGPHAASREEPDAAGGIEPQHIGAAVGKAEYAGSAPVVERRLGVSETLRLRALSLLCDTIDRTGGVVEVSRDDGVALFAPRADPTWVDLGEAYLLASVGMGMPPLVVCADCGAYVPYCRCEKRAKGGLR